LAANAYDADATELTITLPDTIDDSASIELQDNGLGMTPDDIAEKFLFIGRNKREDGQRSPGGRLIIGSKGIGKLAGFGVASIVEVLSWRDGILSTVTIDRDSLEDLETLSERPLNILTSPTELSHGTKIRLLKLNEDLNLPSADSMRRHLYKTLPKSNLKVVVNDVECTAEDIPGERHAFSEKIDGVGEVSGFYIVANARQPSPGLSVRVRGRIVKEPSLFGLDTSAHGFFTAEKIVGEVVAEFLDSEDDGLQAGDLINTTRDGFLEDSPVVKKFDEWVQEFLKRVIQGVDDTETRKRTDAFLNRPAVRERLDRMPAHIRSTATKVVRSILAKLKNVAEEEAAELIEWVLRYYESNVLRELMRAIIAADATDAEKLSGLIREWGLKQVNSVVDIIKTQIDIIEKLEQVVISNKSLEIDVHSLVESNLWLIREGLELWSSDKPLKGVLEGRIDELYKGRENIRPDLVCRSRNDGNEAVIMEFKRPKETVVMAHVTQALEYEALIKKHRPNISFTTYVVGREYDPSVLAAREKLVGASLHLWSLQEILQRARMRFEEILKILGR
jgi:Histidine kinase-, DNA gyrase B-, and HSP90-like ATPase